MDNGYQGGGASQVEPGQAPPPAVPVTEPQAGAAPPEPITKADLELFSKNLKAELLHVISSQAGRTESKLRKEVDQRVAQAEANLNQLKADGYTVTDEDFKRVRSQAIVDASMGNTLQAATQAASQQPIRSPELQQMIDDTNRQAKELEAEYGVTIEATDQEYADYVSPFEKHPNPQVFLKQLRTALEEKAARTNAAPPKPALPGNPQARTPAPMGAGGVGREDDLNKRLQYIQNVDPFKRDVTLSKERAEINKELEALHRSRR
jgi:hypothetical protein